MYRFERAPQRMDSQWGRAACIWSTKDLFYIFRWRGREGETVESETWLWEIVTDMWQGGTDLSLDELGASPRSVCQNLALSRCQAWVASWQAFECVCHVRLGWNRSWTHTHVMTLTRCHQARHQAQTESLANKTFISSLLLYGFLSTSCCFLSLRVYHSLVELQPQPLTSNLGLNDYI